MKNEEEVNHACLSDFHAQSSLELAPVAKNALWEEVENTISPNYSNGPAIIVRGKLHGSGNLWERFKGEQVKIALTANSSEVRDEWVRKLSLRVAPADVLQQLAKELSTSSDENVSLADIQKRMESFVLARKGKRTT